MSVEVIGIEGFVTADAVALWGAAALRRDGRVWNSVTKRALTAEAQQALIAEGHLSLLESPIEIGDENLESPVVLAMVRLASPFHRLFVLDAETLTGLSKAQTTEHWQVFAFEEQIAFESYANRVTAQVMQDVLYAQDVRSPDAVARHRSVLRNALGLNPASPDLNALHVFFSPSAVAHRLASASLRGDIAKRRFESLLEGLRGDSGYEIEYRYGAAKGGGLNVDVAANTLGAVSKASKVIRPAIHREFTYLREVPPPRLRELKAASAHLLFVPKVDDDDKLGDRVARYLELERLGRALDGDLGQAEPEQRRDLESAVQKILSPAPDTVVLQKKLSDPDAIEVPPLSVDYDDASVFSGRLELLGVISGLSRDDVVEVQLAPQVRLLMDGTDDGTGNAPLGVELIRREGTFLRRPCFAAVEREQGRGAARFLLKELRLLPPGKPASVTALPSMVLKGAFLIDRRISIGLSADGATLTGDFGQIASIGDGTLESAQRLTERLQAAYLDYELEASANPAARWIPPQKPQTPTPLARVLGALRHLGGNARVFAVRALIEKRFGVPMRPQNTRKVVLQHPDLLLFADDGASLQLTARGLKYHDVYIRAGGVTQRTAVNPDETADDDL